MAGPVMDIACATYEGVSLELDLFPRTKEPVWILGKEYITDREDDNTKIMRDIRSRYWFTYRKNFQAIGGTGPTADTGWGCMLRCGQMIFAQALTCRHLGRDWQWEAGTTQPVYMQILQNFLDKKDSLYSIHQIGNVPVFATAQMGVSEGKPVGSWFGPNTIAQVLKKLTSFDDWSSLCVHIAMDNTLIVNDISKIFSHLPLIKDPFCSLSLSCPLELQTPKIKRLIDSDVLLRSFQLEGMAEIQVTVSFSRAFGTHPNPFISDDVCCYSQLNHDQGYNLPPIYGTILQPHQNEAANGSKLCVIVNCFYHCNYPSRMNISDLDPSIALGFFCNTEEEFDDLCAQFHEHILSGQKRPMFELAIERPPHWPSLEIPPRPGDELNCSTQSDFTELNYESDEDKDFDTDGEYEILSL
ncbi:unnamed protein product [Porites evermanni]|uniref:Cysteine protease n=1 Tax=Porites evermanni TaxID=104178 RepID=A0ABN8SWJ4_9CNID|nr:unnamed protein product [Porites evermanni]